jgi:hypothetical protein
MLLSNPSAGKMRRFDPYVNELIFGKSILIMGSAPSVVKLTPKFMDSFDLICRVNNFSFFNECKRTDIWYTMAGRSIKKTTGDLKTGKCKLAFLKTPFRNIVTYNRDGSINKLQSFDSRAHYIKCRKRWFEVPFYLQNVNHWRWLTAQIGQIVTTGLSAIVDLYRFNPKSMHVAGFDFFSSRLHNISVPIHLKPWPKHHDFKTEFLFARKFINTYPNISVDETIKKLFAEPHKFPKIGTKPDARIR